MKNYEGIMSAASANPEQVDPAAVAPEATAPKPQSPAAAKQQKGAAGWEKIKKRVEQSNPEEAAAIVGALEIMKQEQIDALVEEGLSPAEAAREVEKMMRADLDLIIAEMLEQEAAEKAPAMPAGRAGAMSGNEEMMM